MAINTHPQWATDSQARALRVEASAAQSLLLAFDQFQFSELTSKGKEQRLRLVFDTHEIAICGHALRRLETLMQRMELSCVTTQIVDSLSSPVAEGQPVIAGIVVKQTKSEGESDI